MKKAVTILKWSCIKHCGYWCWLIPIFTSV